MGRVHRPQIAGGFYHVISRGNTRSSIFKDTGDYVAFLRQLEKTVERFEWLCHGFCLMPNHDHLIVETPEPNLGAGMQVLNLSYARFFNWRYRRVGHVFQGPYRCVHIRREEQLVQTARYVALNPVRAGLVPNPEAWPWTSYRATAGLEPAPAFLQVDRIRGYFRSAGSDGTKEFRAFVNAPLASLDFAA